MVQFKGKCFEFFIYFITLPPKRKYDYKCILYYLSHLYYSCQYQQRITDSYIFGYVGVLLLIDLFTFCVIMGYPPLRPVRIGYPSSQAVETNVSQFYIIVMKGRENIAF